MTGAATWLLYRLAGIRLPDDEIDLRSVLVAVISGYAYFGPAPGIRKRPGRDVASYRIVAASLVPMVVAFKFVLFLATLAWIQ